MSNRAERRHPPVEHNGRVTSPAAPEPAPVVQTFPMQVACDQGVNEAGDLMVVVAFRTPMGIQSYPLPAEGARALAKQMEHTAKASDAGLFLPGQGPGQPGRLTAEEGGS